MTIAFLVCLQPYTYLKAPPLNHINLMYESQPPDTSGNIGIMYAQVHGSESHSLRSTLRSAFACTQIAAFRLTPSYACLLNPEYALWVTWLCCAQCSRASRALLAARSAFQWGIEPLQAMRGSQPLARQPEVVVALCLRAQLQSPRVPLPCSLLWRREHAKVLLPALVLELRLP